MSDFAATAKARYAEVAPVRERLSRFYATQEPEITVNREEARLLTLALLYGSLLQLKSDNDDR